MLSRFSTQSLRDDHVAPFGKLWASGTKVVASRKLSAVSGGSPPVRRETGDDPQQARSGGNSPCILVAEDNPVNQLLVGTLLDLAGYPYEIVENGAQAVEATRSGSFDLILMDIRMPVMSGIEATREIRALPENKRDVPIVAMTASTSEDEEAHCLAAGVDLFLTKPLARDHFIQVIRMAVGQRHTNSN